MHLRVECKRWQFISAFVFAFGSVWIHGFLARLPEQQRLAPHQFPFQFFLAISTLASPKLLKILLQY